jgi:hypothetical protein
MHLAITGLLVGAFATSAHAQSLKLELGGFGGASTSISSVTDAFVTGLQLAGMRNIAVDEGSSFKWAIGGNGAVAVTDQLLVGGEFISNRVASPSVAGTIGRQSVGMTMRTTLSDFTGGVQYMLSSTPGGVVPYLGAGFGVVRMSVAAESADTGIPLSTSAVDATYNVGGGVRIFASPSWGIRPDVRIVHFPGETYVRTTVGLFYQVR